MTHRTSLLCVGALLLLGRASFAQTPPAAPGQPQSRPGVTEPDPKAPGPAAQPPGGGSAAPS